MVKTLSAALVLIVASLFASVSLANDEAGIGLIKKQSAYSFDDTVAKLEAALAERNIGVMNTIDHAAGAQTVDQSLRPTTLLIFGNPAIGSQLMAASQSIGIDLPLKALVYEDENGVICVEYNDIAYLARRHGIAADHPVIARIAGGLEMVTDAATRPAE
ncbi:MAG: DUF302 domain-containing protein [Alphaproteobacteria bacterium]|nr:DUF302 domain-containing protein [Alphaproteobacteria bacterium]